MKSFDVGFLMGAISAGAALVGLLVIYVSRAIRRRRRWSERVRRL